MLLKAVGDPKNTRTYESLSPPTSPTFAGVATNQSPEKILDYLDLDSLEPPTKNHIYQSIRLQKLTIRVRSTPNKLICQQLSEYLVDILPSKIYMLLRRRNRVEGPLKSRLISKKSTQTHKRIANDLELDVCPF